MTGKCKDSAGKELNDLAVELPADLLEDILQDLHGEPELEARPS